MFYYISKNTVKKNYPDTTFLNNEECVSLHKFGEYAFYVHIKDSLVLDRKLKLYKLNNDDNILYNFIKFVNENKMSFNEIMYHITDIINDKKYGMK